MVHIQKKADPLGSEMGCIRCLRGVWQEVLGEQHFVGGAAELETGGRTSSTVLTDFALGLALKVVWGLPGWHGGKESACQHRRCKRHRLDPCVRKFP